MSKQIVPPPQLNTGSENGQTQSQDRFEEEVEFVPSEMEQLPAASRVKRSPSTLRRERQLAALAHAALLLNRTAGVAGTLVTLVLWIAGRDRFPYLCRQAGQALFWQLALILLESILHGGWNLVQTVNAYWGFFNPAFLSLMNPLIGSIALLLYFIWGAIAMLAALCAYYGFSWRYPLTGNISLDD